MSTDLRPMLSALGDLDDDELHALIATVNGVPQIAPGLLAWIEHAADWEVNRRRGVDWPLQPPEAAIDPSETGVSIDATVMLRERFAQYEEDRPAVVTLFDAIVGLLSGGERKH